MGFLLLQGGMVLVHGDNNKVSALKTDILVEDDRITRLERDISPPDGAHVIDCEGKLISPGFVDTHHHVWQSAMKGLFADAAFFPYMAILYVSSMYLTAEDVFWGNLAGSLEAIDAGTTTTLDHAHMNWTRDHSKQAIAGTLTSGIRSIFAYTPSKRLKQTAPEVEFHPDPMEDWIMEAFEKLARAEPLSDPASRVQLGFGWDYYFLPKDVVVATFEKVRSLGATVITSHFLRTTPEPTEALPSLLKRYGLLDERIVLSHAGGASPADAELLREARAFVSATPSTEQSMAAGPSVCFRDDLPGIDKVCSLGIDCHSATSASIVNEMRVGLQTARAFDSVAHRRDRGRFPEDAFHRVEEAYNMGTIRGARALGMERDVGSIAVGKKADLVVFDAMSPAMIGAAQQDPVGAIVLHSSIGDIETVIVDGEIRKRDGKLLPVKAQRWQEEGVFVRTEEDVHWREVAKRTLGVQERLVSKLAEHDLKTTGDSIARMFGMK